MLQGPDQTAGRILGEGAVDRGHHPVEPGQHLVRIVEAAVDADVRFGAREQMDLRLLRIERAHRFDVLQQPVDRKASRIPGRRGVVGDRGVAIAPAQRLLGQLLDGEIAVAGVGVAMEIAADVAQLDQLGQLALFGGLDLAAVLAQLGRDPRHAEALVDLLLGGAAGGHAGGVVEDPVLGDVQPAPDGRLAQRHVVLLGAREVLQDVAELVGLDDPQVDRHARVRAGAGGVVPGRRARLDDVEVGEHGGQGACVRRGGDDVEVLDRVGAAARRAGQLDAIAGRVGAQRLDDALGDGQRLVEQNARARLLVDPGGEGLEHRLLELGAEAAQAAQALGLGRGPQVLQRRDAEVLVEPPRALGAQPGEAREIHEPGRELGPQLLDRGDLARLEQRVDLLLQRPPDPGQLGHPAVAGQRRDRGRRLADRLGRVAVGEDPVDHGAVELVEVGELVEEGGDRGVGRVGHHG